MESTLHGSESLRRNWAFYWRPYWKGIVWLICFLGASALFTWLHSVYLTLTPGHPLPRLHRISVMLLNPFIWLGALLSWRALHKNGGAIDGALEAGSRTTIKNYLLNALSLFVLISIAQTMLEANQYLTYRAFSEIISVVGWRFIITTILVNSISFASIVSLGVSVFLFVTVTYIPQEQSKLTAIILPAMLTILLYEATFYLAMHGLFLFTARFRFHIFGMHDMYLYQQLIALPLIFAVSYIAAKRSKVGRTGAYHPACAGAIE